jgi:hypothetical protein
VSDYTKVFDGATKDSGNATVLGADHDTEFDAISTAIASKMDKVTGATLGNLAELDADGNLVDSGVASEHFDNVVANIDTRLDAAEATIVQITPPSQETNHERATWTQLEDGSQTATGFDIDANITENTFETVGPTGSGATNIWAELDVIPSTARAIILNIDIQATIGAGDFDASVYAAVNGVTALQNFGTVIAGLGRDATSGQLIGITVQAIVPCDSSQIFQMTWSSVNETAIALTAYYKGFINDSTNT